MCFFFKLAEYLVRMSRALAWSECSAPPAPGADTTLLAETLIERAEKLTMHHHDHHDHHTHTLPLDHKHWDNFHTLHPHQHPHSHTHHLKPLKLRRERSCHDLPVKETTAMYNLQRKVHSLKDQIQRKDLQIELLKRKLTLTEEGVRGKCIAQVITFVFVQYFFFYFMPISIDRVNEMKHCVGPNVYQNNLKKHVNNLSTQRLKLPNSKHN